MARPSASKGKGTVSAKSQRTTSNPVLLWSLGGVLFVLLIPLSLLVFNPFTGVRIVERQVEQWKGRAGLECAAPKLIQWIIPKDSVIWAYFAGGTQVRSIQLSGTEIQDRDLWILNRTPFLKELNLTQTAVTDQGMQALSGLAHLEVLSLGETKVGDEGMSAIAGLTELKQLDIRMTRVTDAGLERLNGVRALETITIEGTRVTPAGYEKLRQRLPGLRALPNGGTPSAPSNSSMM